MGYTEKISEMTLAISCRHSIAIYINHWKFNDLNAESHFDKLSSFTCIRNLFSKLGKSYNKTARHVYKSTLSRQWFIFVSVDLHLKAFSDNFVIILEFCPWNASQKNRGTTAYWFLAFEITFSFITSNIYSVFWVTAHLLSLAYILQVFLNSLWHTQSKRFLFNT